MPELRTILSGAVAVLAAPAASASAASHFQVATSKHGTVSRLGSFHPLRDARLGAAVRAFGEPGTRDPTDRNSCVARWPDLRLTIEFANYGAIPRDKTTCANAFGLAQSFSARGRRFRTVDGVRPGLRSAVVGRRDSNAVRHRRSWWLETFDYRFGDVGAGPVLRATVRRGRVHSLVGYIGGAGE